MRLILTDQDLSGQTIDVSKRPDGHARQAYIGRCNLQGTKIIGDIQGSDILECQCEGLDLSEAKTFGCQWTGSTFDETTIIPSGTGRRQLELVVELLRRAVETDEDLSSQMVQRALEAHSVLMEGDYDAFCAIIKTTFFKTKVGQRHLQKLWQSLESYPDIQAYIANSSTFIPTVDHCRPPRNRRPVQWGDGVTVWIDGDNLPALKHPGYRYELGRWIEQEAGPVEHPISVTERHVWVAVIRPEPVIFTLTHADEWMEPHYALMSF